MWSFLTKIFKLKKKNDDWLERLFDNIERVREQEMVVPFRIINIRTSGFQVKIKGLFGFVPFSLMPWKYNNSECWAAIFSSLKEKTFFGKVITFEKSLISSRFTRIIVDAKVRMFKEVDLYSDVDYSGIVFYKNIYGVFIEIGVHFNWKYGSIQGFLPVSRFPDPESYLKCEPGQQINVNILEKKEKGYIFKDARYRDLYTIYVGKTIQAKTVRSDTNDLIFLVEDQYKAKMPIRREIYGNDTDLIMKIRNSLPDGTIINCEVLNVSKGNFFSIKFLPHTDAMHEANLALQKFKSYLKKTVMVRITKHVDGSLDFLADDTYKAIMPFLKQYYYENLDFAQTMIKDYIEDGEVFECIVMNVNVATETFSVKFLHEKYLLNFIGKTVKVTVSKDDADIITFSIQDKYCAELPITRSIYGDKVSFIKTALSLLVDHEKIDCVVLDICVKDKLPVFIIKILPQNDILLKL